MDDWLLSTHALPLALKVGCTLFVGILVPIYWRHWGPANFLWFSDLALFITTAALWLENPFLASMQAVAVGLLELMWNVDFVVRLLFGVQLVGIAGYMFETDKPLYLRALSLFHVPLPLLLFWLVHRLGYDSRAWMAQTVFAWIIVLICFFFTKPEENINWSFGPGQQPQKKLPPWLYLMVLLVFLPTCVYWPTHLILLAIMPVR